MIPVGGVTGNFKGIVSRCTVSNVISPVTESPSNICNPFSLFRIKGEDDLITTTSSAFCCNVENITFWQRIFGIAIFYRKNQT